VIIRYVSGGGGGGGGGSRGGTVLTVAGGARTSGTRQPQVKAVGVESAGTQATASAATASVAAPVAAEETIAVQCLRGGLVMVGWAFDAGAGGVELKSADVLGGQGLPEGTAVWHWNPANGAYDTDRLDGKGQWEGNVTWKRGAGFWIVMPANAPEAEYGILLKGLAPVDEAFAQAVNPGLNQLGYPYPKEAVWAATALARGAAAGDTLLVWDEETSSYVENVKGADGEWSAPEMTLRAGQGFWFRTARDPFTNEEPNPDGR